MTTSVTPSKWAAFIARLAEGDTVEAAARFAKADRRSFKRHREADPQREGEFQAACDAGTLMLEQRLVQIARGEVEVKGMPVVTSTLLVLKRRDPEWRDAARQNTPAQPKRRQRVDLSKLSNEDLAALDRLLERAGGDGTPEP